ncbi:MAG: rhodanese-like domain-containing protein [Gammaproteobacteria bacterium]|nr:rhodanese-like domain-containing protein [Gammaproteobacteria bacterium]
MISKVGYKELVEAAEARIQIISAEEAIGRLGSDEVVFVDLRDVRELKREGGIPGAFHCPRGLLEFWIDPESPYHHAVFAEPKEFIFFCNLGWRSALAADIAQQMGLKTCHIDGGFKAWKALGGEVAQGKK